MAVINVDTPIKYTLEEYSAYQFVQQPFAEGDHGPDSITELRLYDGEVRRAFLQLDLPTVHLCLQICSLSEAQKCVPSKLCKAGIKIFLQYSTDIQM